MCWIKSNVITNARWEIESKILWLDPIHKRNRALKSNSDIFNREKEFIANYNPIVYCNDLTGEEWCFDTKLPTGGWLENIKATWSKDGTRVFRALIMC